MTRTKATVTCSDGVQTIVSLPEPPWHEMWDVPEVLENILVRLPMKDLLLDQRVCTQWRDLIQAAPRLQEALFFKPISTRHVGQNGKISRERNSLLEAAFPGWFVKPLRQWGQAHFADVSWATSAARLAILRRDASWRRMLTAQPPLAIWEEAHGLTVYGGSSLQIGSVEVKDGIRMGLVYDRTELVREAAQVYMVSDGYLPISERLETEESTDPDCLFEAEGKLKQKRFFGGQGILTLVKDSSEGCCVKLPKWTSSSREFLSAGAEDVDIHMKDVEGSHGYNWWTEDGYHRPDRDLGL